ncbi:MAG TPA: 16S rRNA (cytosine(1402)-N(4))-methyltransferase RsmH [Geminicoccaceae bacterium]|jgi:16S rRNA (cytosine1402-N4)-methyltransferase
MAHGRAHTAVLLDAAVEALLGDEDMRRDGTFVDATFGRGGHARALLARLGPAGRLIALDRDPEAVAHARADARLAGDRRFSIVHTAFSEMPAALRGEGVERIDGVLLDLGVSSPQLDDAARGFSFRADGPLDMRMDPTRGESAAEFLARADEAEIARVIRTYGEERFASRIARLCVARREAGRPLTRTAELAALAAEAVKTREKGLNPATRTFQGLRIFVNAELEELERALEAALEVLRPGGRLVAISFHSLEDRIVKAFIARESREVVDRRVPGSMLAGPTPHRLRAVARVRPSEADIAANPRARSAILRVAERTDVGAAP